MAIGNLLATLQGTSLNARTPYEIDLNAAWSDDAVETELELVNQLQEEIATDYATEAAIMNHWATVNENATENEEIAANFADALSSPITAAKMIEGVSFGDEGEIDAATLQSDAETVTLQVFKRARDTLKRMVEWFVKLYEKVTRNIYKWFQKHVGYVARAKRKNDGLRKRIEKLQGATIDEKNVSVDGWATALQVGGTLVADSAALASEVGTMADLVTKFSAALAGTAKFAEKLPEAITDIDGAGVEKFNEANKTGVTYSVLCNDNEFKKYKGVMDALTTSEDTAPAWRALSALVNTTVTNDVRWAANPTTSLRNHGLLGNMNLYKVNGGDVSGKSLAEAASDIRGRGFHLAEFRADLKKTKNDGKLATADLTSCEGLITSCDQLLDEMGAIMNGDDMYAVRKELDKANDNYKKKTKEFSSLEFTANVRGILSVLASNITAQRRNYTDTPMKLARLCRGTVNATQRYVSASLSNHKKA